MKITEEFLIANNFTLTYNNGIIKHFLREIDNYLDLYVEFGENNIIIYIWTSSKNIYFSIDNTSELLTLIKFLQ